MITGVDPQEAVSTGQAVKAMVISGLGFCNRPLMLTPQFFSNLPTEELIGAGISAEDLNRHRFGRVLRTETSLAPHHQATQLPLGMAFRWLDPRTLY